MATKTGYTAHETISLHECLRHTALGISKLEVMLPMPTDGDLKEFMQAELAAAKEEFGELRTLAQKVLQA